MTTRRKKKQEGISFQDNVKVFLDGKHIGNIIEDDDGYRYWPKSSKTPGEVFATIVACKRSLY